MSSLREVKKEIDSNVVHALRIIENAKKLADEHGLDFQLTLPGGNTPRVYIAKKDDVPEGHWQGDSEEDNYWSHSSHDC